MSQRARIAISILATLVSTSFIQPTTNGQPPASPEAAPKVEWSGWLGPQRNGWVSYFDPPAEWPEKLQPHWKVEVGEGYATPLVVGDAVFVHARQGEDEVLTRLNAISGKTAWRKATPTPFKMGGGGEWHGKGPKANPVYADGRVFTMSITGALTAWDAESGKQLWRRSYEKQFAKTHPYWGATASPIVDGDRLIVRVGNDDKGLLVALDVKTGKDVWTLGDAGPSYSSPLVVEIAGVRQVVEWNHESLIGVEATSGKLLWSQPFPHVSHNQNMPTPSVSGSRILLGAENRGIHCFEPALDGGKWTVQKRWSQDKLALDMSSAVVHSGKLFGMSHYQKGRLFCLTLSDGEILWEGPPRAGSNFTFLAIPNQILALSDRGRLQVLDASSDGLKPLASYSISDSPTWAAPVLLPDSLLVKGGKHLSRLGIR